VNIDMKKRWTYENTKNEALKYQSRGDFQKGTQSAYNAAKRNGWLDEVCSHMTPKRKQWTFEEVHQIALQYSSTIEMQRGNAAAYSAAQWNGWWKKVSSHMTRHRPKWNVESVKKEALKYRTRRQFQKGGKGAYAAGRDLGILDEVCSHMETREWTLETLKVEAKKYNSRSEFLKGSSGAYGAAKRLDCLDLISEHMEVKWEQKWDKKSCAKEAKKYRHRKDFHLGSPGAYGASYRNGWLDDICSHMTNKAIKWTRKTIIDEAKKYKTRTEFSSGSGGAYKAAIDKGILEQVCSHMEILHNGYYHCVYAIYNKRKNQAYVGITSQRFEDRMTQHRSGNDETRSRAIAHLRDTVFEQQTDYKYPPEKVKSAEMRFIRKFSADGFEILNSARAVGGIGHAKPSWTKEMVQKEANKFQTRWEFQRKSKAYAVAKRRNWLDEVCSHMTSPTKGMNYWTLENCKIEASGCSSVKEFRTKFSHGHKVVCQNKWNDEVWSCFTKDTKK
jgi:hypothetical protein